MKKNEEEMLGEAQLTVECLFYVRYSHVDLDDVESPREGGIDWKKGYVKPFGSNFAFLYLVLETSDS